MLPGAHGLGFELAWELPAEASQESTRKTFTQQETVPSPKQAPSPKKSGFTHYKGLNEVPFLQSALPRPWGCLLLLWPLKLTYLQPTMERLI